MTDIVKSTKRDLRLDFFRGLALFFIFIDHVPDNFLSNFTLTSIGFSDAAHVFVFVSGYAAALVYGAAMRQHGTLFAAARVYRRVWQLYVAHIFLFVIFTAEVSYTVVTFNNPLYNEEMRVADFLAEPHIAIIKALLLQFQPTFLDILPLYIVLLAIFPIVLLALGRSIWVALVPSVILYVLVHIYKFTLPGYPANHAWFFNPFAWQLLFVIGAICGFAQVERRSVLPTGRWFTGLAIIAGTIVIVSAAIRISWTIHWYYDPVPALLVKKLLPLDKSNLGALPLLHFLALAIVVVSLVPAGSRWLERKWVYPVILCGQHSLHIFCLGILLAVLGHFALVEINDGVAMQFAVNAVGALLMIGTAWLMSWYKLTERISAKPALPQGSPAP